ncbi:DUF2188 domain-containing protein [Rhizobium sp. AQ_MP]|uniref:DUF2188 domain-containing protein n=1 Tax=Rhizobium sp. AQ_MP TaxID=2761536 RepID=UPI00163AA5D3|nr:DUF2188 domain-containing protein [Rhizobium sp. AQ_MP]MBC2774266.1 DUF2188 domain-containing protein [Rhizobium sp. AQ_MP]
MVKITYEIVPHDGGWAYRLGGVYSEAFATHDQALEAARIVMEEQQVGDEPVTISYQDESGRWREEYSDGGDRPEVEIVDAFSAEERPQA